MLNPLAFIVRRLRARRRHARMFDAALAFNRIHTFAGSLPNSMWRCPSCGTVHRCISLSKISGRQFPQCCEFEEGHRLDTRHATGIGKRA